jgi:hypothetical protein
MGRCCSKWPPDSPSRVSARFSNEQVQRAFSVPPSKGPAPEANGAQPPLGERPGGLGSLIAEAEALRTLIHEAGTRTARLLAALKQQRRQSQAVRAAVASLRQLQLDP